MSIPARAGLQDIRVDSLPQDDTVRGAYSDVLAVEDMVRQWSDKWPYSTPKSEVASRIKAKLEILQKAAGAHPDNEDLLLLTGLVAHYAYNVDADLENTYDIAVTSWGKAKELAPQDHRPEWFLGIHICQADSPKEGMAKLLAVEGQHSPKELSFGFWDDYIECGVIANVPVHVIRAGEYVARSEAPPSKRRDALVEIARKRLTDADPNAAYPVEDVWSRDENGSDNIFKNRMFGLSFKMPSTWKISLSKIAGGVSMARIQVGPYETPTGNIIPNILVVSRRANPGESLADFLKSAAGNVFGASTNTPVEASDCPAAECLAVVSVKPALYGKAGDGHATMTVFGRTEPDFPGLILEEPASFPSSDPKPSPTEPSEKGKVTYYHASVRFHRLHGAIYYMILLDTASSVFDRAKADYAAFLKNVVVE